MAFNAVEWLESISDAVRSINSEDAIEARRRELALGRGCTLHDIVVSRSRDMDVMRPVDDIADFTEGRSRRTAIAQEHIAEAVAVFDGMREVGHMEAAAADVLELIYVHLMPRDAVAADLDMSRSSVQRYRSFGIEWLSAHGVAHAKNGVGMAAV